MKPTTYQQRFVEAITRLCNGVEPPYSMVRDWLDKEKDSCDLQEFCIANGPEWCQGIVLLDAAHLMAMEPEEGAGHEYLEQPRSEPESEDKRLEPSVEFQQLMPQDVVRAAHFAFGYEGASVIVSEGDFHKIAEQLTRMNVVMLKNPRQRSRDELMLADYANELDLEKLDVFTLIALHRRLRSQSSN